MRIILIAKYIEGIHSVSGGLERHISDLIAGISKNHIITIITSKHPKGKKELIVNGIKIYFVNESISRNPISRIKFFKAVSKKLKELDYGKNYDLLHIESDFGIGVFNYIKKEIPVVTTVHGCLKNDFKASINAKKYLTPIWALVYPKYKSYEKSMLYNSDKVVCVSETLARTLKKEYPSIKDRFIVIHNGVNSKQYYQNLKIRTRMRKKYNLKKEFVLLFVGSLIMKKGLQNIIKVLPDILKVNKNVKLFVIGSGDYKQKLEQLVKKNHLEHNVIFLGRIDSKKMVCYYNLSDLLVMPSLFIETFPYTILEAMACGLPALASHIGGVPEIINNKDYLYNKDNLNELQAKLIKIVSFDLSNYSKESINAINKNYSIDKMIKNYNNIYKKVLI